MLKSIEAPCVLASERPSHPDDERIPPNLLNRARRRLLGAGRRALRDRAAVRQVSAHPVAAGRIARPRTPLQRQAATSIEHGEVDALEPLAMDTEACQERPELRL